MVVARVDGSEFPVKESDQHLRKNEVISRIRWVQLDRFLGVMFGEQVLLQCKLAEREQRVCGSKSGKFAQNLGERCRRFRMALSVEKELRSAKTVEEVHAP